MGRRSFRRRKGRVILLHSYLKKRKKTFICCFVLCLCYNLYFLFLLPEVNISYLVYLDVLLAFAGGLCVGADAAKHHREMQRQKGLLKLQTVIYQEFPNIEGYEIIEHDVEALKKQLNEQFEMNCDLQDYIAKWCHEVKIPLSASLLMAEKIEDSRLRASLKEQLERINQQLKSALFGCKAQSSLFDIQMRPTRILDCVKTSVHNNQFFLIKQHFQIEIDVEDGLIYTDKNWFVYVLDQCISNAVKYACDSPFLKIWSEQKDAKLLLFVEDHGEGIDRQDIRRVFEKGYTGSGHHNGKYKSTGMGLYMSQKIMEKLGHELSVESEKGRSTRFLIEAPRA